MDIDAITNQYSEILENDLRSAVPSPEECPDALAGFYEMLRYHLGWSKPTGEPVNSASGKRIRPVLCLLACEAAGGDYHAAVPLATCIELLHNFTLIHDDIQDRSEERRHRQTVWKIWGEAQGINAGDAMYSLALLALLRLSDRGIDPSFVNEAVSEVNKTLLALSEGQFLDISFEQRLDVAIEEYLSMIERKTAALIGSSAWLGAYFGSANLELAQHYRLFGRGLGMAFQIQDDILGIWGDPQATGKPAGDDILQKKKTLPFVFALQAAKSPQRQRLLEIYASDKVSEGQVREVRDLLDQLGAKEYAGDQAKAWHQDALLHLDEAEPSQAAGEKLRELAWALLKRSR